MLRQFQQQKLLQKLSPQQIQLIKLLEIPSVEMAERVLQEVDANPALELGESAVTEQQDDPLYDSGDGGTNDEFTFDDYAPDDDIPDYKTRQAGDPSAADQWRDWLPVTADVTLNEFLLDQLNVQELTDEERKVATFIVGNIDDDGYLRRTPEALCDDLSIILGLDVPLETIKALIGRIQALDPPGVGAADLQECLILQLKRKEPSSLHEQTIALLETCFAEVSRKQYEAIVRKLSCSEAELKAMMQEITKLNPKPGNLFGTVLEEKRELVVPDFLLENHDGYLTLALNRDNVPELHVSREYLNMVSDYKAHVKNQTKEARDALVFAREKVESAKWFIDAVKQRQETLMRTMQAIVEYQEAFFREGDEKLLKPMILKDIAERTGYDISTISRVSNSKYIQTEFGLFPLRYFFTEGMQTDSGESVSSLEIKAILQESIDGEDKKNPLTDDQLSAILKEKGYVIARRTVAKYRDQLGLPVARLRREM